MDKLEPILKNHFWILLVPLLSMNLWGYFSANSALKEATKARESALDTVKSGIAAGTTDPNEVYATELKKRNEVLEKYVNEELLDLWKRQQERMVWPPRVAADIPKVYLSDIKNNKVRYTYQTDYADVLRQLHESVEPFVADKRGITWTPKVDFPFQLIPQMKIGNLTITSKQMWDAQEDVWVTQFILNAIRQMNKDADSETSAVVRRVLAYRLLGGEGTSEDGGEAAASEGSGGAMDSSGAMSSAYQGSGNQPVGGFSGGQGGQATRVTSAVKFDPAEEFGPGGEPEVGGAGRGNGMTMQMSSSQPTGEADAEATVPTGPVRYVKEVTDNPYVERGFYLSVIINQNKLVDFMVALSNSEWPVRVVRFHFGKNPYATDPFTSARGGGGNLSAMGMRGRGGMSSSGYSANPSSTDSEAFTQPASSSSFTGSMAGGMGAAANTGYPVDALQHPDLVQLDLAGLITMYRQPPAVKAALEAAATGGATNPEASAEETPVEGEMLTDPATPAAGEVPTEAPAVESGVPASPTEAVPATEPVAPADPVPAGKPAEKSAETPAPSAETPGKPVGEPVPAVPAPAAAAESPPAKDPANP